MPLKIEGPLLCSSVTSRRYNEHLINDWSLGEQLILFPENLKVSRGGALTPGAYHLYENLEIPERIQMNLTVHPGGNFAGKK